MAPPRYDEAFKEGAIRMVCEQGRLISDVALKLDICVDTLRSWLKKAGIQAGQANRLNREQQKIRELETELKIFKKQVSEKDEVINMPDKQSKKSLGILSKPQRINSAAPLSLKLWGSLWSRFAIFWKYLVAAFMKEENRVLG